MHKTLLGRNGKKLTRETVRQVVLKEGRGGNRRLVIRAGTLFCGQFGVAILHNPGVSFNVQPRKQPSREHPSSPSAASRGVPRIVAHCLARVNRRERCVRLSLYGARRLVLVRRVRV